MGGPMRFKGNEPLHQTPRPDPDQREVRYPREVNPADFSTIETVTERENKEEDEANVEAIEQTSQDYWGRRSQETDGAVPTEPPDRNPLDQQRPRKPKGPPKNNM